MGRARVAAARGQGGEDCEEQGQDQGEHQHLGWVSDRCGYYTPGFVPGDKFAQKFGRPSNDGGIGDCSVPRGGKIELTTPVIPDCAQQG